MSRTTLADLPARLVRGAHNMPAVGRPSVVTIGNFDGVHKAHQVMLELVKELALKDHCSACVMTFEPSPQEFFSGANAPARLMTTCDKFTALAGANIDYHVVQRFNTALASMSAQRYIDDLLVGGLGAKRIVVGDDFRFGKGREGTAELLRAAGLVHGFEVHEVAAVYADDGTRISSTAVREALAANDFAQAERLLGRPYRMSGRVIQGEQLGRTLGFATANIVPHRRTLPIEGIFAVRVSAADGTSVNAGSPGVASLGTRPTVGGKGHLLEVHLFNFQGNLYGQRLEVEFVAKLRSEAHFDNIEMLTEQMHKDAAQARHILAAPN